MYGNYLVRTVSRVLIALLLSAHERASIERRSVTRISGL